jgi:SAM-dependent methyltransferase
LTDELLPCGAHDCRLAAGPREMDAGMLFIRCPTCAVLRIPPAKLIHQSVLPDPPRPLSLIMRLLMSMRMLWLRGMVPALRDQSIQIVDAGCGDGQFLEFLQRLGYCHVIGIEPEPERLRHARARKVPVVPSKAAAETRLGGPLAADIVIVWHVLEHVPQPLDFLRNYGACLKSGGMIIVSVPNQQSIQTRLFGYFSAFPDYGRHLWYHDRSYVEWLRTQLPFHVAVLRDFNFEYEIFSWVDSIASAAMRRQNAVHKALKKGEGSSAWHLAMVAVSLLLLPAAAVLSCLSLASGRGSTLTFVVRRSGG